MIDNNIIPMKSLGGFHIGQNIIEQEDFFTSMLFRGTCKLSSSKNLFSCSFEFSEQGIRVSFNVFTRRITQIESFHPYQGTVVGTDIQLGITVKELLKKHPKNWDGDDSYLWNVNYPGLFFGFLEEGKEFLIANIEKYNDFKINTISLISPSSNDEYDRYGSDWFEMKKELIAQWKHIEDEET